LPHVSDVLIVTAILLISRRLATRDVLGLVDWHLLVLFGGLFIVTAALAETGLPADALRALTGDAAHVNGRSTFCRAAAHHLLSTPTFLSLLVPGGAQLLNLRQSATFMM
jgi:Na+/H+ antiporter NhaD/arsenite permease-like protein